MRMLVVGAGAVGGYLGARWIDAGLDVTLLVRGRRGSQLAGSGLVVVRGNGDLVVRPKTILADELTGTFDVVFIAVAGDALAAALGDIAPAVGPETSIVTALNGVRHFHALRTGFGDGRVLGSVVKCVTALDPGGSILEISPLAQISIGRWSGSIDDDLLKVRAFLENGGLDVRTSSTIEAEINEKWLMMLVVGAANCLLGGDVGAMNVFPTGAWVAQEILDEGRRALEEIGKGPRRPALEALARMLADASSRQTTSLYRNMLAGRRLEIEPIIGDLMSRVADHRAYPLLSAAYARLSIYEAALPDG